MFSVLPLDAKVFTHGTAGGAGVHICSLAKIQAGAQQGAIVRTVRKTGERAGLEIGVEVNVGANVRGFRHSVAKCIRKRGLLLCLR